MTDEQLEALKRDAFRYRWLRENNGDQPYLQIQTWRCWFADSSSGVPTEWKQRIIGGSSLDANIDAAILATGRRFVLEL